MLHFQGSKVFLVHIVASLNPVVVETQCDCSSSYDGLGVCVCGGGALKPGPRGWTGGEDGEDGAINYGCTSAELVYSGTKHVEERKWDQRRRGGQGRSLMSTPLT